MNSKLTRLWATKTKQDEWWSSFVTAPLAILVNYLVVDWCCLTPNRITALSFAVAFISAALVFWGDSTYFIAAAVLIQISHILDCMDGQMARYRRTSSPSGSYYDRLTDQVQVILWFGAVGYSAHIQSGDITPIFLVFVGVSFYGLRGYSKYVHAEIELLHDRDFLEKNTALRLAPESAGLTFGWRKNIRWFLAEQRKFFSFDEGVLVFMLSAALIFNQLTAMLWLFAASQLFYGIIRPIERGIKIHLNNHGPVKK
jgi:phosphatidylglycerophosphate synthase